MEQGFLSRNKSVLVKGLNFYSLKILKLSPYIFLPQSEKYFLSEV